MKSCKQINGNIFYVPSFKDLVLEVTNFLSCSINSNRNCKKPLHRDKQTVSKFYTEEAKQKQNKKTPPITEKTILKDKEFCKDRKARFTESPLWRWHGKVLGRTGTQTQKQRRAQKDTGMKAVLWRRDTVSNRWLQKKNCTPIWKKENQADTVKHFIFPSGW